MYWLLILVVVGILAVGFLFRDKDSDMEIDSEGLSCPAKKLSPEEKHRKLLKKLDTAWEECWEYTGAYSFDMERWNSRYSKDYECCEDREVVSVVDRLFREYGTMQIHYLRGLLEEGMDQILPAYEQTIDQVLENLPHMFSSRNGVLCLANCPANIKAFSIGMHDLFHKKIPVTAGEKDRLLKLVEGY